MYLSLTVPHAELLLPEMHLKPYLTADGRSIFEPEKAWPDGQHYGPQPFPKAAYAGMVSSLDHYVGLVLDQLAESALEENTLVLFATDNGTHVEGGRTLDDVAFFKSSGPFKGTKRDMYEGGIRTPFLAQWKGRIDGGTTTDHIGAFWDVLPTLAELAGAKPSASTDGISFVPTLLRKKKQPQHPFLYWEFYERGFDQAVRKGKWKAVKFSRNQDTIELYDLDKDPGETTDLAKRHPDVREEMRAIFEKAHTKSDIFPLKKRD
jgi:arylsulfatase A